MLIMLSTTSSRYNCLHCIDNIQAQCTGYMWLLYCHFYVTTWTDVCVLVCLFTELQQSVNSEEEWVLTMAACLNNYRHLARLEQLMREKGKLTMSVVECLPLGPPRIGKTCLKDRLAGKKPKGKPAKMVKGKVVYPNKVSMSTGTVEGVAKMVVETVYQEQEQGKQWVQRTFNQEIVSFIRGAETSHFPTQAQPIANSLVFLNRTSLRHSLVLTRCNQFHLRNSPVLVVQTLPTDVPVSPNKNTNPPNRNIIPLLPLFR